MPTDCATPVLSGRLLLDEGKFIELPVRFLYLPEAPYSVVMEFPGFDAAVGAWEFSRDLLWEGLHTAAGVGDVRIWPPCPTHGLRRLRIMLQGEDGTAMVEVPAKPVRSWLRGRSFALVPRGHESERAAVDWDAELTRLVRGR
ncbi:SsgA family sporulation/cell division regulator [Streptomyces sp. NPDC048717]|uniref:SsgA family sporulation/cell division regulator n=1 Tax=Streptomyces sp. NPDC048717 TaxID=3154928 RepID=UPI0034179043